MSVNKEGTHSSEFSTGKVQMSVHKECTHSNEFNTGKIQMSVNKECTHGSEFSTGHVQMSVHKEGTHGSEFSIGNIQMSVNKECTHSSEFSTGNIQMSVNKEGTHSSEFNTGHVQMSVNKEGTHSSEFSSGQVQMSVDKEGTHGSEFSTGNIQMSVNKEGTHSSEFSTGQVQMSADKEGTHGSEFSTGNIQMGVNKEGTHGSEFSTGNVQMVVDSASIALHRPANTDNSKMVVILAHNSSLDNKANVSDSNVLGSSPCIIGESFLQDNGKCELVVGNIEVSIGNLTNKPSNTVEKKCLKEFVEDIAESVDGDDYKRTKFEIKVKELKLESDDFVSRKRNETISKHSNELEIISRHYLCQHFFRRHDEVPYYAIREYYFNDNIYPVFDGYDIEEFRAILEYILASIGRRGVVSEIMMRWIEYMSRRRNGGVIPLYSIQDLPMPTLLYRESDPFLSMSALLHRDRALHLQAILNWPDLQPQQPSENEDQNVVSLHLFRESTDPFNRIYRHQQELNTHRYANTNAAHSENENGNREENSVSTVFQPATESHQENHSSTCQIADIETCAIEAHATDTYVKVPESRPTCECAFGAAASCACNRTEQALSDGSHLSVDANDVPLHEHRRHFPDCRFVQTLMDAEEVLFVCIICQQNDIEVMFLPCYHAICCEDCSNDILHCQLCGSFIAEKVVQ